MTEFDDELEALRSIFCRPGEFEIVERGEKRVVFSVRIKMGENPNTQALTVTAIVTQDYPNIVPSFCFTSSSFSRSALDSFRDAAGDFALTQTGGPFLWNVFEWIQENANGFLSMKNESESLGLSLQEQREASGADRTVLIQLDHMRNRSKYTKALVSWAKELNVAGATLFYSRWIFIVASGEDRDVGEFVKRLKTSRVDVDSKGLPCKEKLSTLLFSGNCPGNATGFEAREVDTKSDLERAFANMQMLELYDREVKRKVL